MSGNKEIHEAFFSSIIIFSILSLVLLVALLLGFGYCLYKVCFSRTNTDPSISDEIERSDSFINWKYDQRNQPLMNHACQIQHQGSIHDLDAVQPRSINYGSSSYYGLSSSSAASSPLSKQSLRTFLHGSRT
uniref:Uncharacterized protein n=1 Tax=Amphimedon queenslandica TaxID=400682 RepID=A0A1X7V2W6_AMPQE